MTETRESLEARKRELFDTIRLLEQDRQDGVMDDGSYAAARLRYELEAATVVEQLDRASTESEGRGQPRSLLWGAVPAVGLVVVALALFLVSAVQHRATAQRAGTPTVAPSVAIAQREASSHPRSVEAQLALGNAYLDAGDTAQADAVYRRVMRLAPRRPEAKTLHAMILGANQGKSRAFTLLTQVERTSPTYARAWLLDGLLASKDAKTYGRALAAWRRFLTLQPHSTVSTSVRRWMADLQRKQKA